MVCVCYSNNELKTQILIFFIKIPLTVESNYVYLNILVTLTRVLTYTLPNIDQGVKTEFARLEYDMVHIVADQLPTFCGQNKE